MQSLQLCEDQGIPGKLKNRFLKLVLAILTTYKKTGLNPILDAVQADPILDRGWQKAPHVNSAIWCLTTMELDKSTVYIKNFSEQSKKLVTS